MATTRRWRLDFTVARTPDGDSASACDTAFAGRVDAFAGPCRLGGPSALGASLGLATPQGDTGGLIGAALSHSFKTATDLTGKADPGGA
jgi:hypothetical protein